MGMNTRAAFLNMSETAVWLAEHRLVLAGAAALVAACNRVFSWMADGMAFCLGNDRHACDALPASYHATQPEPGHGGPKSRSMIMRPSEAGNHMIGVERLEAEERARLADNRTL